MQTENVNGATLETWSVDEVAEAWDKGQVVIIDVRTPPEYMMEHIAGSLLMPVPDFDPARLPEEGGKRIVLMCGSAKRSEKMARKALGAGWDRIAHLEGGFGAWKKAGRAHVAIDMATGAPQDAGGT